MLSAISLTAHEHEHGGSTSGLFGLKPEYLHVLLNPIPVYGLAIGLALLAFGIFRRNQPLRTSGLIVSILCAAAAWPVLLYGQHGYNSLSPMLDTDSSRWLELHMHRAERFVYFYYATAALAVAALIASKKSIKAATVLSTLTLVIGFSSLAFGAWISRAGGQISHSEFRAESATPSPPSGHQHGTQEESRRSTPTTTEEEHKEHASSEATHHQTEAPDTNAAHQDHAESNRSPPAATSTDKAHKHTQPIASQTNAPGVQQPTEHHQHATERTQTNAPHATGERLPDTPEATWTELHKHHHQLAEAVKTRAFDQVHAHAEAIEKLAAVLVAVVHPDYKPTVQKGTDQIVAAVKACHKSAHAEDAAGLESNFKVFENSLHELEQKMKKQ